MRYDKSSALKLRLAGKSYSEITASLGIPKATLSGWLSKLELSEQAKQRIAQRAHQKSVAAILKHNKMQTHLAEQRARSTRNGSRGEIKNLLKQDLLMIGVSLYWAEGYKRPKMSNGKVRTYHPVSLSNSDPNLVRIFIRFLREVCSVPEEKITGEIRVYEHHNIAYLCDFWSKATGIPLSRLKTIKNGVSISSQRVRPFNTLPYGTIQIRVNNSELYHRIMGWIDGLSIV